MTQYIAENPLHCVVRSEIKALHDTAGRMIAPKKQRVFAKFRRGEAPGYAYEVGKQHFEFRGKPDGLSLEQWMAYYDSVEDQQRMGWSDEEREAIEEKLATRPGVIEITTPKIAPPWPGYDTLNAQGRRTNTHVAEKIAEMTTDGGYDVGYVIAYESQEKARPEVVAALQALIDTPAEPVEEEVLA